MSRRASVITLLLTLSTVFGGFAATLALDVPPRLGLDLQGGFSVVLEAPEDTEADVLDTAVEIMRRRIEALGDVQEPEISVLGERNIEVQLPGVTDRDRALAAVGTTGRLEFRPVLDVSPIPGLSPLFLQVQPEDPTTTTTPGDDETTTTTNPDDTTTTTTLDLEELTAGVVLPEGVTWCDEVDQPGCVDRQSGLTVSPVPELEAFLATDFATGGGVVYHLAPASVLGANLTDARAEFFANSPGSAAGQWVVSLRFDSLGAQQFQDMTRELARFGFGDPRRQIAIVLDATIQSAPPLGADVDPNVGIPGGQAIISMGAGGNPQTDAQELSVVLRYGALPVALEQVSVQSVSATLGADSMRAGIIAGVLGLVLVSILLLLYYRALGLVSVVGLLVFASLVLTVLSLLGAWRGLTVTMAGVTGLIVTIGISSDAYIVYFERIKEEVRRGRSLRAAIDHAYGRSLRTIVTASALALVGSVLLFLLATASVKGFALAFGIATVASLFITVAYMRPAVSLLARTRLGDGGRFSIRGATGHPEEAAR
ncbi:MAG TPA: protein translocase subunit SecD [Acidimicrobiia bacterium]|nr:protein translocase subunit SecD [Acidimicrobiia bacterium]